MKIPKSLLPHRVTIIPFLGSGGYGARWESDETKFQKDVPCRIESKIRRVKSLDGDDVFQSAEAVFHPDYEINQNDKIVWSRADKEYKVEEVIPVDALGPHSLEVILT